MFPWLLPTFAASFAPRRPVPRFPASGVAWYAWPRFASSGPVRAARHRAAPVALQPAGDHRSCTADPAPAVDVHVAPGSQGRVDGIEDFLYVPHIAWDADVADRKTAVFGCGVCQQWLVGEQLVGFGQIDKGRDARPQKSPDFLPRLGGSRARGIRRPESGRQSPNRYSDRVDRNGGVDHGRSGEQIADQKDGRRQFGLLQRERHRTQCLRWVTTRNFVRPLSSGCANSKRGSGITTRSSERSPARGVFSVFHALRRHEPSLSLGPLEPVELKGC